MAADPEGRRLLYALVAGGFVVVVGILIVAAAELVPGWWTAATAAAWVASAGVVAARWRHTALVLGASIGLFMAWTVGTLLVS